MTTTNYWTEGDKSDFNSKVLDYIDSMVGKEDFKPFKNYSEFAKTIGVSRATLNNMMKGKNSVTLDFFASLQNMVGEDFDARFFLSNKRYINPEKYNLPEGFVAVPLVDLEAMYSSAQLQVSKCNRTLKKAILNNSSIT